MSTAPAGHRIGEFSRRVGVSPDLLRAWEHRYGLLTPVRSPGGFRLYGEEDAARVARMRRALESGLSAAQAARVALDAARPAAGRIDDARARLLSAVERYDEADVQSALDDALAAVGLETFIRDLILPTLTEVGQRWADGEAEISQEHFASHLIRGRLLSLARLWGRGAGPLALLACAPGERHDISLLAFGLLLRSYGWRILFLGADTPILTVGQAATATHPDAVVIVAFDHGLLDDQRTELRRLGRRVPVYLSGPGAEGAADARDRVHRLDGDVVEAAHELARTVAPPAP
ncbi:MAG TPA: B12-binding domain-containing protein [Solirubrobacteraceae bacterium]|nr:B12-binding domain-containing protein [Solirubrobacteraceae bacterium]